MPRLESGALQAVESADAVNRIRESEDSIMLSMIRFKLHAVKRRREAAAAKRGDQAQPMRAAQFSEPQRSQIRGRLGELADSAS